MRYTSTASDSIWRRFWGGSLFTPVRRPEGDAGPSLETEHLLHFRLAGRHPAIGVDRFLKRNHLDRRRFQSSLFKTGVKRGGDFRCLLRRQPITIYSNQVGEIVIEIDEVKTDALISAARDSHLTAAQRERTQRWLEHWAANGVKDSIDSFSPRKFKDSVAKIFGLGIDHR